MEISLTAAGIPGRRPGKTFLTLPGSIVRVPSFSNSIFLKWVGEQVPGSPSFQTTLPRNESREGFSLTAPATVSGLYQARKSNARPQSRITATAQPSWIQGPDAL